MTVTLKRSRPKASLKKKNLGVSIFSVDQDHVVNALVATARADYEYAIESLVPQISRLDIQRKVQNPRFYDRLKRDILKRCVMPAITLAFVNEDHDSLRDKSAFEKFVNENIAQAFVLDGIQRLSTLDRAFLDAKNSDLIFPSDQPLLLNVLICRSIDNLLYRMITLNNGQRPMTTRHQIEILTANLFPGDSDSVFLVKEKDGVRKDQGIFAKSDFVLGYIAFLSSTTNVDSQKLIQEKLDELLASKILEHDPTLGGIEFSAVMKLIGDLSILKPIDKWFKVNNNLIGFCASIRFSYDIILALDEGEFLEFIETFEEAFHAFNVAKIRLGRARRRAVAHAVKRLQEGLPSVNDLMDELVDVIEPA